MMKPPVHASKYPRFINSEKSFKNIDDAPKCLLLVYFIHVLPANRFVIVDVEYPENLFEVFLWRS